MGSSSETSESVRDVLEGLRLFARGSYRLMRCKLRLVPGEYLAIGCIILAVAVALSPWWLSSTLGLAALVYVLSRSEKEKDEPCDVTDTAGAGQSAEPSAG